MSYIRSVIPHIANHSRWKISLFVKLNCDFLDNNYGLENGMIVMLRCLNYENKSLNAILVGFQPTYISMYIWKSLICQIQ